MGEPVEVFKTRKQYRDCIADAAAAWFAATKRAVRHDLRYCLAERTQWRENIILPEVAEYVERHLVPLQKDVHSGLSSQAMLLNLIGPLVIENNLQPIRAAIAAAGVALPKGDITAEFEFQDPRVFNEDRQYPTSIDLRLGADAGAPVFVEAKLTEAGFGGCAVQSRGDCSGRNPASLPDNCYLTGNRRTYWAQLSELGFMLPPMADGLICPLALHYQFFREVGLALSLQGYFVLLYDQRSPVFFGPGNEGLMPLLREFVPPAHVHRVHAVTIQSVVQHIREDDAHNDWLHEFEHKYGMM